MYTVQYLEIFLNVCGFSGWYLFTFSVCVCVGDERGAEDQQSHGDQLHARGLQVTAAPSLKQNNRTVHLYAFTSENAL